MSTPFKGYVIKDAMVIAAFNSVMNASYTAYLWWGREPLALFDDNRVALDLANTPMVIALLSTLLGTHFARNKLSNGRVTVAGARAPELLRVLPNAVIARALVLAAVAGLALGIPVWLALWASGIDTLPFRAAVSLKVFITIIMSLAIVPVVILAALSDVQRPAEQPRDCGPAAEARPRLRTPRQQG